MPDQGAPESYEDRFGRVGRRLQRLVRGIRWGLRGLADKPHNFLVEIRWRLGDEIMAIPIYEGLKRAYPGCRVSVLCNYPELLEGNPFVDGVNEPSPLPDRYVLLRSDARNVFRLEHYARCAGIDTPGIGPKLYYGDWGTPLLGEPKRPLVALAAGASWPTKRWPVEHWRDLARQLTEAGAGVVELGQGDERIGVGTDLVGRTGVADAARVLHEADLLVCCDSGLMHLALAVDTAVLALFGPTEPTILIQENPDFHVVQSPSACRGCWNVSLAMVEPGVCPLGREACLASIAVDEVMGRARALLGLE